MTYIDKDAFGNCHSSLYTECEFGKYVRSGDNPYAVLIEITNKNMSTYTINENTKIIAGYVFDKCSRLTSITIPDSVTAIGYYAFNGCNNLKNVYYTGSETEWQTITIGSENYYLEKSTIHYNYVPENN